MPLLFAASKPVVASSRQTGKPALVPISTSFPADSFLGPKRTHFDVCAWLASGDVFSRVVEPMLYGDDDANSAAWKVSSIESSQLLDKLSVVARQTAAGHGQHNLTYGEVLPASIAAHVVPALRLMRSDIFYDLGSGTGKIPLQIALAMPDIRAIGVEFALARHELAQAAYHRAATLMPAHVSSACAAAGIDLPVQAADICAAVRSAISRVTALHGNFLELDMSDATVVFVNNTVFEPQLTLSLTRCLAALPRLRTLVVLRTICKRHRERCAERGEPCAAFEHPPVQGICNPTWCDDTTIFTYQRSAGTLCSAADHRLAGRKRGRSADAGTAIDGHATEAVDGQRSPPRAKVAAPRHMPTTSPARRAWVPSEQKVPPTPLRAPRRTDDLVTTPARVSPVDSSASSLIRMLQRTP